MKEVVEIIGRLKRFRYQGHAAWSIAELETVDGPIWLKGPMPGVYEGDRCTVRGVWVVDKKWGRQVDVKSIETDQRLGAVAVLQRLPTIGPARAELLHKKFGDDVFDVLEKNPEAFLQVDGITRGSLDLIRDTYIEKRDQRDLLLWCGEKGIGNYHTALIEKHFGVSKALTVLKGDPYRLTEIDGIAFLTADKIARRLGAPALSPRRAQAAVLYVLRETENTEGSTALNGDMLLACMRGSDRGPKGRPTPVRLSPPVDDDVAHDAIRDLRQANKVALEDRWVQLTARRDTEKMIASFLAGLAQGRHKPIRERTDAGAAPDEDDIPEDPFALADYQ